MIWDGRSPGTWGDWCMAFALGKPIIIEYIEPKTMADAMREYYDFRKWRNRNENNVGTT